MAPPLDESGSGRHSSTAPSALELAVFPRPAPPPLAPAENAGYTVGNIDRLQSLLRRRFAGGGCFARASDLAQLPLEVLPGTEPPLNLPALAELRSEWVEEALHGLWEQGSVEIHSLADGTLLYRFPRS